MAITQRACEQIRILKEDVLSAKEREKLILISENRRRKGIALANKICKDYRREGLFFDEILQNGSIV